MRLNRLLYVIDFIFVFNLYYTAKRSEMTQGGTLNCNKSIHFLIAPKDEIWEYEDCFQMDSVMVKGKNRTA